MTKLHLLPLCLILMASPVLAQSSAAAPASSAQDNDNSSSAALPSGPPVTSAEAFKIFVDTCTDISGGTEGSYDRANAAGWIPNDADDSGPYNSIYSGSREIAGLGEVDIWGSVQNFPTQRLGYCRVDFSDSNNVLDFKDMAGVHGLTGSIQPRDGGNVYGAWEAPDKKLLVIGDRSDGAVELEFNLILGEKPKS
jgi:hypothetical protein